MHKDQLTQKFNGERHTVSARLPHRHIISLMKVQLDYRNSENSQFYQAWTTENTVVNGTCYHQLYLQEVQFISIHQIPWRTSNACITWLNRDTVVHQFFFMPRVSN